MKLFRVDGPPGCGKTTYLQRQAERGARTYGSDRVVIASLTRAAAAEVAGRNLPLARRQVGTLHSHAFSALGLRAERLAESPKALAEWNGLVAPCWRLSGASADVDDPMDAQGFREAGDPILALYHTLRHRMTPTVEWPTEVRLFAGEWEHWKAGTDRVDFTDMIDRALRDVRTAPGNPALLFIDEAQDLSRLELALVQRWGAECESVVIVGDTDQALYQWRGSDPEAFNDLGIPEDHFRVLEQSYRVPRAVHAAAVGWIERTEGRRPIKYRPRDEDGEVRSLPVRFTSPDERFIDDLRQQIDRGRSCMILTSCAYMLDGIVLALREHALPFHNPYRVKAGRWNPLRDSTRERILAYLRPDVATFGDQARFWSLADVQLWAEHVRAELFAPRMKSKLEKLEPEDDDEVLVETLLRYFGQDTLTKAYELDVSWWADALTKQGKTRGVEYAVSIVQQHGGAALREQPKLIVGTIHSVKGGEADCVYLFPDLSSKGSEAWDADPNSVRRVFYVAMTRARHELILCEPSSPRSVVLS